MCACEVLCVCTIGGGGSLHTIKIAGGAGERSKAFTCDHFSYGTIVSRSKDRVIQSVTCEYDMSFSLSKRQMA